MGEYYENTPMQYTEIQRCFFFFSGEKKKKIHQKQNYIFKFYAQNIHHGCTLVPPLSSTHQLCFEQKIRKIGILLHTPVLLYNGHVILMYRWQRKTR